MLKNLSPMTFIGLLAAIIALAPPDAVADKPLAGPANAAVVRLEGRIDDHSRDAFFKHFEKARGTGAKVIIVDLDTYGGAVTAGLEMAQFLRRQSDLHTIAYVRQKAISAGSMIAIACNEIVMGPEAMLGDCAPIAVGWSGQMIPMGKEERAKSESIILEDFRSSALLRGYDPLLVQSMVQTHLSVHWVQDAEGTRRFVGDAEFKKLVEQGWTQVQDPSVKTPIDDADTLLTVNTRAAVKLGLANEEHPSLDALATARNYTIGARFEPSAGDKVIEWLSSFWVRIVLVYVLFQSIYAAFHAPAHGAEVIAVLALALLVGVPLLTGYASWWEILIIFIGIALLALEIFVIPGFGVTGIAGLVMILFGLLMTFVAKEPGSGFWPRLDGTWIAIRNGLAGIIVVLIVSFFMTLWLRRYLPRVPYLNKLILTTVSGGGTLVESQIVEAQPFRPGIGAIGEALSELKPGGSASFYDAATADNQVVSVISDVGYIARGTRVVVHNTADNNVIVRPAPGA